jgi:hypothetical protein
MRRLCLLKSVVPKMRRTKDAIPPDIAHKLVLLHRHCARCFPGGFCAAGLVGLEACRTDGGE